MNLSIVIPTLNAAATLSQMLRALEQGDECIIVDAFSTDSTREIAAANGAMLLVSEPGRGGQLRAGAVAATGDWLLFLHADTELAPGWRKVVEAYTRQSGAERCAAVFRFSLDSPDWRARLIELGVAVRVFLFGLPYGDQGLLIRRSYYEALGGYDSIPIMEDVDFVRRIGRQRIRVLPCKARTSAIRWRSDGWVRRSLRNLYCLFLFYRGVSPFEIRKIYES